MPDGLGPYANIQLVTLARGVDEINQHLALGWTLLDTQIVDEVVGAGGVSRARVMRRVLVATMGRSFNEGEDAAIAREHANEIGADALESSQPINLSRSDEDEDELDNIDNDGSVRLPAANDEAATEPAPARRTTAPARAPREKEIADGRPGKTTVAGIRGGR